ncbi:MAG: hypothetical protein KGM91_06080 [Burkholderiales bacterium]|nr:hypothetical protein [Burkholderiales bacterium]
MNQPDLDWELYRALREQWTHEDNLVNHRMMWLILSQGLLFTAYGGMSGVHHKWLVLGFPFFGMAVAAVIGSSIAAAVEAAEAIQREYAAAGLERLCRLSPMPGNRHRGRWAARALPFVFAALWVLAFAGSIGA